MRAPTDFHPVYSRHDLLIEIGKVEMAIDHLGTREDGERAHQRSQLESQMARLRAALEQLAA